MNGLSVSSTECSNGVHECFKFSLRNTNRVFACPACPRWSHLACFAVCEQCYLQGRAICGTCQHQAQPEDVHTTTDLGRTSNLPTFASRGQMCSYPRCSQPASIHLVCQTCSTNLYFCEACAGISVCPWFSCHGRMRAKNNADDEEDGRFGNKSNHMQSPVQAQAGTKIQASPATLSHAASSQSLSDAIAGPPPSVLHAQQHSGSSDPVMTIPGVPLRRRELFARLAALISRLLHLASYIQASYPLMKKVRCSVIQVLALLACILLFFIVGFAHHQHEWGPGAKPAPASPPYPQSTGLPPCPQSTDCMWWPLSCHENLCLRLKQSSRSLKLANFTVTAKPDGTGVIRISDPCYDTTKDASGTIYIQDAKPGKWIAGVDLAEDDADYWMMPVLHFWAIHSEQQGNLSAPHFYANQSVDVDSGSLGIWDDARMPRRPNDGGFYDNLQKLNFTGWVGPVPAAKSSSAMGVLTYASQGDGGFVGCSYTDSTTKVAKVLIDFDWDDGTDCILGPR